MIGEFSDFPFGDSQNLCHFRKGAFRLERREPTHDGTMFPAVLLKNQFDHVVFQVMREINVNVGQFVHRHPVLVEKPAKIEIKADGANPADLKAVANQRVRGAAACYPFNPAPPAFLEKIPSDEKILLVTDLVDDA